MNALTTYQLADLIVRTDDGIDTTATAKAIAPAALDYIASAAGEGKAGALATSTLVRWIADALGDHGTIRAGLIVRALFSIYLDGQVEHVQFRSNATRRLVDGVRIAK